MLKRIALLLLASLLVSCGGGGGSAGTSLFGGGGTGGTTGTTASSAASIAVLTSAVTMGSGGDTVTITAIVKDAGNASVSGAAVKFSSDSGTLTNAATVADASGTATATLSAGSDKSNRTVNVTVTSGSAAGTVSVAVVGTTLTYSGATTIALAASAPIAVKATDSKGAAIQNVPVTVVSSLGNTLSASPVTTNTLGNAALTYTAANSGADTLTFSGFGATASANILISAANFAFVAPAPNVQIPVATNASVTVKYLLNGVAQVGKTINFSATAGAVTPASAATDANGLATVSISSSNAGAAVIQATVAGGTAQATLPVSYVAQTPARVVLQVSPTAIAPNAAGSTSQQAKLVATVTDANGNPVSNATVSFNAIVDPSGGTLSQASAQTDSSGQATVQYISGGKTTPSNGVQLQASVVGTAVVSPVATMTVNQSALFIALGTDNQIQVPGNQTYLKKWVVYVTDSNGVAVPGVLVTFSVLPVAYGKGVLIWSGTSWVIAPGSFTCPNEDTDYSGVYSAAKDTNGNGKLDPGNVISVSTSNANGTVTTDANGLASVSVIYAESYAPWVNVNLQARAVVSGTESSNTANFTVVGAAADFTNQAVPPAGVISPFGTHACNLPN